MKELLTTTLIIVILFSCKNSEKGKVQGTEVSEYLEVKTEAYELLKPVKTTDLVLVLFGGYPEKAADIEREFKIASIAKENEIALVYMNFNRKLWLEEIEKQKLAEQLHSIFKDNDLPTSKIYFGGYSSGGNMALLISDFLKLQNSKISPKGVFVVDSPIDLAALYKSSEKNIDRNFSEPSIQESTWILETLGKRFGPPKGNLFNYEAYAIYTSETNNFENIKNLKQTKIRFYSEPDSLWWKENRLADYDQMNAYYLDKLFSLLKESGFKQVEYIKTENRGYRANGERHPHSWSIVDKNELINWMRE